LTTPAAQYLALADTGRNAWWRYLLGITCIAAGWLTAGGLLYGWMLQAALFDFLFLPFFTLTLLFLLKPHFDEPPAYLSLPADKGGVGLATATMSWFVVVMQAGMWLGYVTFGFVSDALGRRRTYVVYLLAAAALVLAYANTGRPAALLALGPLVAFFGTGYFSGFGAVTAEIYPTAIRATAQGFTYNIGRLASAVAPFVVGSLADARGFAAALSTAAVSFVLAALIWAWIPETRGRELA